MNDLQGQYAEIAQLTQFKKEMYKQERQKLQDTKLRHDEQMDLFRSNVKNYREHIDTLE